MAQHNAEIQQAQANATLVAMQQEVVLQQDLMQPLMVQAGMKPSEDKLTGSVSEKKCY